MPSEELRARYRAMKRGRAKGRTEASSKGVAKVKSNADTRARHFIERWMAGETHQQIADSLGVKQSTVTQSITAYRRRHPDCPIPVGRQDRNEESE